MVSLINTLAVVGFATTALASPWANLEARELWHSDDWLGCVNSKYTAEKFTNLSMSPKMCQDKCASTNYMYAVITSGTTCACTNDIADNDVVSELLCTVTCPGNVLLSCGGAVFTNNWDVYLTPAVTIG